MKLLGNCSSFKLFGGQQHSHQPSKMSVLYRKKGVSPLIASVLLIAFTLAIGAFMSTWLHDITKKQTDEASSNAKPECQYATLNFKNVTFNASGNGKLSINLENTGFRGVSVTGIRIIYDDDKITKAQFNTTFIGAGDAIIMSISNSTDNGSIRADLSRVRLLTECPNNNIEYSGDSISGAI